MHTDDSQYKYVNNDSEDQELEKEMKRSKIPVDTAYSLRKFKRGLQAKIK